MATRNASSLLNGKLFRLGIRSAFILKKHGIQVSRVGEPLADEMLRQRNDYLENARAIYDRHWKQSREDVLALQKKYDPPVFGKVRVWKLVELLAQCIDPSDPTLYCVSQWVHALQVVEGMERGGIDDADFLLAGIVHDLGKVLLLTGEAPENVVCLNTPIGSHEKEVGLDNCTFQWNHDQFIYGRLKDYVPDHIAWLLRYHSIYVPGCEPLMNARDRDYTRRYLTVFQKFDKETKSVYRLPSAGVEKYRSLIEDRFPAPIPF